MFRWSHSVGVWRLSDVHCARVFSTCCMGAGLLGFSEGMGEFLVCLGFLQVLDLVCNQAVVTQISPFIHYRSDLPLVLSFLKTNGNFNVPVLGLLWDFSQCDTFNNQIVKVKSRTCKEGTKQGFWQLTSLTIFLGWGLQASSCTPVRRNNGLMFDSDQIRRRAEHQASDRLSNLSHPSLFFPLTRLATDWQGYTLPGWQQSL